MHNCGRWIFHFDLSRCLCAPDCDDLLPRKSFPDGGRRVFKMTLACVAFKPSTATAATANREPRTDGARARRLDCGRARRPEWGGFRVERWRPGCRVAVQALGGCPGSLVLLQQLVEHSA